MYDLSPLHGGDANGEDFCACVHPSKHTRRQLTSSMDVVCTHHHVISHVNPIYRATSIRT